MECCWGVTKFGSCRFAKLLRGFWWLLRMAWDLVDGTGEGVVAVGTIYHGVVSTRGRRRQRLQNPPDKDPGNRENLGFWPLYLRGYSDYGHGTWVIVIPTSGPMSVCRYCGDPGEKLAIFRDEHDLGSDSDFPHSEVISCVDQHCTIRFAPTIAQTPVSDIEQSHCQFGWPDSRFSSSHNSG